MIYDLIPSSDPLLHEKIKKCSYNLDRKDISFTLNENMLYHNGVGVSANQLGIKERCFVMIRSEDIENLQTLVVFNPKVVKYSVRQELMEEGCLSYPDLRLPIRRPYSVIIKYEDAEKNIHKTKMSGFIARVFQHEYDHMEGIDFTQRQDGK